MKILIVDDTLALLEEISEILVMEGYDVITASDGQNGLEKISKEKPDVVITDLVMPEVDGYFLIQKVRSLKSYSDTPIIVLSAQAAKENVEKAYHLRADKYLKKPCSINELLAAIDEVSHGKN